MKKSLLMLAAHFPSLDPRVLWEATSASKIYDVCVVGIEDLSGNQSQFKNCDFSEVLLKKGEKVPFKVKLMFLLWLIKRNWWSLFLLLFYFSLKFVHVSIWFLFRVFRVCNRVYNKVVRTLKATTEGVKGKRAVEDGDNIGLELGDPLHGGESEIVLKRFVRSLMQRFEQVQIIRSCIMGYWICNHVLLFSYLCINYVSGRKDKNFNIYHCNDFDTLLAGLYLRDRFGGRVVYDAHEFWPHSLTTTSNAKNTFLKMLEGAYIKYADTVITVNPLLAEKIAETYELPHVESILNAEPLCSRTIRTKLNDTLVFLYQGNFAPDRGLEEVVAAWAKLCPDDAVLMLRGPDSEAKSSLAEYVDNLGCVGIEFPDAVSEAELVDAAHQADVGVIPYKPVNINYKYCCPNKLSQYLHAGLAVMTNDLAFVSKVVDQFEVGYIYRNEDLDSIVDVFSSIISDRETLLRKRENAVRTARDSFNWEIEERNLLNIYERVSS